MLMTSFPAHPPRSCNRPPNLPPRAVPFPCSASLPTGAKDPDIDRLSKFGRRAITSQTRTRVTTFVSVVKEVTDCGNTQNGGGGNIGRSPVPSRETPSTFGKHGAYSRNCSGTQLGPLIQKPKSLTWRAGFCSGTGNALNHLSTSLEVKMTVRKRCLWHDRTHDFDTRAHARRDRKSEPTARRSKISSTTSCGILGVVAISIVGEVEYPAVEWFEFI